MGLVGWDGIGIILAHSPAAKRELGNPRSGGGLVSEQERGEGEKGVGWRFECDG